MNSSSITFFENLMSPYKEIREQSEANFVKLKTFPFDESLKVFAEGMTSPNEKIFQMTTLILKKTYLDDKEVLNKLTPDQIEAIKSLLQSNINLSFPWISLQRVADALAILYSHSNLSSGFGKIIVMLDNPNQLSRQFSLYLIENLCDQKAISEELVKSNLKDFIEMFSKGLKDEVVAVKVRAVSSIFSLLFSLTSETLIMEFKPLADKILETLVNALKERQESILSTMNTFITKYPKFWKEKIDIIIDVVCQVTREKSFNNTIRETALELVYSFANELGGGLKKSGNFNKMFIPLMFELSLELDNINNVQEWEKETEEKEVDKEELYYGIGNGFDRLSQDLGGKYFIELTAPYVKKCLQSTNWIEVHAGYMAMANMAEGCKESYKSHLQETLNFISVGLSHVHPRVRYAALTAFGLIVKETSPDAQIKYANNILPALAQLMGPNELCIRVKTQSCSALVEFLRGLLSKTNEDDNNAQGILKPYSDDLVKLLTVLFEESLKLNYSPLQESTLSSFSLLSNLLNKHFAPYYTFIMPGLKKLFYTFDSKTIEQQKLKSNCIEAISFLSSSIHECPGNYLEELKELSQAFLNYLVGIKQEDPQYPALLNSFIHFSLSMKEHFLPIFDKLLAFITPLINEDIGVKFEDVPLTDLVPHEEDDKTGSIVVQINAEYKKFSLNSFAFQNKMLGLNILNGIAKNMGTSFFPYVERVLKLAMNFIKFQLNTKIRKTCIKIVFSCLNACNNDEERSKILLFIQKPFFDEFDNSIKMGRLKDIKAYLKNITDFSSLIKNKNAFSEEFILKLYQCLQSTVKLILSLKKEILTKAKSIDEDEDNEEILAEEFDNLNEQMRKVMEVSGIIFKLFGEPLTQIVTNSLSQLFLGDWQAALERKYFHSDQELLYSICFFCDYMEYSSIEAFNLIKVTFINVTYNNKTDNEDMIQSVIYGYGIICQKISRQDFNAYKDKIVLSIVGIIQRPIKENNESTFDNAVGAMGKYICYQCDNDDNGKAMSAQFIKLLPLKFDLDEGKVVTKMFCSQILEKNPILVTEANMPLIKEAISKIGALHKKETFLEEEELRLLGVVAVQLNISM